MKKYLIILMLTLGVKAFSQTTILKNSRRIFNLNSKIKESDYLPNVIIVKYRAIKPSITTQKNTTISSLPVFALKSASIISVKNKFALPQNGNSNSPAINQIAPTNRANKEVDLSNIYEIKYSGSSKIEVVINELLQDKNVEYAEPSYVCHTFYVPNDPLCADSGQFYLNQVQAPKAWDIIRSASDVTIAVVDNGCDLTHEDLENDIFLNKSDPINGIDDDHDGYIDNYQGWDLAGASLSNIQADNDPSIKKSEAIHGTHVSGLASAVSDNKTGIASIGYNAKLLIVKAAADDDPNTVILGYEGIKYAADHGAQIINCSWGTSAGGAYGQDIINYAISKNCLIVAAAGNSNSSDMEYPAAYKGVLAVANVQNADIKAPTSNFGNYIGISAPGTNILSTLYHNTYGVLSGTSMSAPIVSSAAALVKSFFPLLSMQQVGERLRVTADKIDGMNPGLEGQLGKGRLNVFNALTRASPSIRYQKVITNSNASIAQGDTIQLYLDLKNFLDPTVGLSVTLSSPSPFIKILNHEIAPGDIATLQTKTAVGPFRVLISTVAPNNSLALFRINYTSNNGTYDDEEGFSIPVGVDYLNVQVNNISTTMTSNGRIGYSGPEATNGLGFIYKNQNLLYEASLMIGNSPVAVSNNARNTDGSDNDFVKRVKASRINGSVADFEGASEFDDSNSPSPLNVYIKHRQIAYLKPPDDKYSIAEYEVFNRGNFDLRNLYLGLFTDWDIDASGKDITQYDPLNKLAYSYGKFGKTSYAGIKLLNNAVPPLYYPLSNAVEGNPLYNGFTTSQKFKTLSSGIAALGLGDNSANGYDVSFVSGYGPLTIPANGSVKLAFAVLAGEDLDDLENSAQQAQKKYLTISPEVSSSTQVYLGQNYPNPVQNNTIIQFTLPDRGLASLDLYSMAGRKIQTLLNSNLQAGSYAVNFNAKNLLAGIYIYRLYFNRVEKSLKMIVIK